MKSVTACFVLIGTALLAGCATLKPEDYGFRRVAISGQDYYCAPRDWVVPPIVHVDAANDPVYPIYKQFMALPNTNLTLDAHSQIRAACITQAQWPDWLTMRRVWNRDWALTPAVAESLAAAHDAQGPLVPTAK